MSNQIKIHPLIKSETSVIELILSFLSLSILFFICILFFFLFRSSAKGILQDELTTKIHNSDFAQTSQLLDYIYDQTEIESFLNKQDETIEENKNFTVKILANSLELINQNKTQKAFALSKDASNAEIKRQIIAYKKITTRLSTTQEEIEQQEKFKVNLKKQFESLASDFSELFNSVEVLKKDNQIIRYKKGELKNMPALKGIPDNIKSLKNLKPYLTLMLGSMNNDETLVFRNKFDYLRKAGAEIHQQENKATENYYNLQNTLLSIENERKISVVELKKLYQKLIINMLNN